MNSKKGFLEAYYSVVIVCFLCFFWGVSMLVMLRVYSFGDSFFRTFRNCFPLILLTFYLNGLFRKIDFKVNPKIPFALVMGLTFLMLSGVSFFELTTMHWAYDAPILYIFFGYLFFLLFKKKGNSGGESFVLGFLTVYVAGFINEFLVYNVWFTPDSLFHSFLFPVYAPFVLETRLIVTGFYLALLYVQYEFVNFGKVVFPFYTLYIIGGVYGRLTQVNIPFLWRIPSLLLLCSVVSTLRKWGVMYE